MLVSSGCGVFSRQPARRGLTSNSPGAVSRKWWPGSGSRMTEAQLSHCGSPEAFSWPWPLSEFAITGAMPELPEVETIRRGLAPALEGASFAKVELRRRDLRFPFPKGFAKRLEGAEVTALGRRAKYLVGELDSGEGLVMHLGMTGRFAVEEGAGVRAKERFEPGRFYDDSERLAAHDHVVFHLSTGRRLIYNDARRFGFMTLVKLDKLDEHPL